MGFIIIGGLCLITGAIIGIACMALCTASKIKEKPIDVVYICDRKACKICHYPSCEHTHDISHAKNFERFDMCDLYYERKER